MPKAIEAVFEKGVFKPLKKVPAREHERYKLVFLPLEEFLHLQIAEKGKSFDFLESEDEDIYTLKDGEAV